MSLSSMVHKIPNDVNCMNKMYIPKAKVEAAVVVLAACPNANIAAALDAVVVGLVPCPKANMELALVAAGWEPNTLLPAVEDVDPAPNENGAAGAFVVWATPKLNTGAAEVLAGPPNGAWEGAVDPNWGWVAVVGAVEPNGETAAAGVVED